MDGTCKHCWNFHIEENSETGTCRVGSKKVKMHKDDPCRNLIYYSPYRVEMNYTVHNRQGSVFRGIKNHNDAINLCNFSNREIRKELMRERDISRDISDTEIDTPPTE